MKIVLAMLYVLLGFSVVVSLFGMVNTMVLSVFERTREIGMLRTIGMTRRQARRMIRHESVITALIGAALGLGSGCSCRLVSERVGTEPAVHGAGPDAARVHAARASSRASARRSCRPAGPRA
jgi:ABC-type lipoprotein release transport system permease subunit